MKIVKWLREEVRKVFVPFLFFTFLFSLIVATDHIMGRSASDDLVPNVGRALVGGLIAAKVILIVDSLSITEHFSDHPLYHVILWKTFLYFIAAQVIATLEPAVRALIHGGVSASYHAVIQHFLEHRTWAMGIWAAAVTLGFVTLREVSRVLGRAKVRELLWGSSSHGGHA